MSSVVLSVCPKRTFDFGPYSVGASASVAVAQRINVAEYSEGILVIRVHSASITAPNTIFFDLVPDGYYERDPGVIFTESLQLVPELSANSSVVAPRLLVSGVSSPGGLLGQYAIFVVSGAKIGAGAASVTISADLWLRCGDSS